MIAADAIVLFVTWAQTFQQSREARKFKAASPVATCLLRDGKVALPILSRR